MRPKLNIVTFQVLVDHASILSTEMDKFVAIFQRNDKQCLYFRMEPAK